MGRGLRQLLRCSSMSPPGLGPLLHGRETSVLLYHDVPGRSFYGGAMHFDGEAFEAQVALLAQQTRLVHPDDFDPNARSWGRKRVLLTFDDGFRNNLTVALPILHRYNAPAVFFVCTRATRSQGVLWFMYLRILEARFRGEALTFRGTRLGMGPAERAASMSRLRDLLLDLRPHPSATYQAIRDDLPGIESLATPEELDDWAHLMEPEALRTVEADPLFRVEAHTVDHPMLTRCDSETLRGQIVDNVEALAAATGRRPRWLAYPSGDYNDEVIFAAREAGLTLGFAVAPQCHVDPAFEIPRAGIYRAQPEVALFKAVWARRREHRG